MKSSDGKNYLTDVATAEQFFRLTNLFHQKYKSMKRENEKTKSIF